MYRFPFYSFSVLTGLWMQIYVYSHAKAPYLRSKTLDLISVQDDTWENDSVV
jgi:hypothetical protein